jgi:inorganic triphosphatase YgiF
MEELFLKTEYGLFPIEEEIALKYNLKKGDFSPFTRGRVADKNGNFSAVPEIKAEEAPQESLPEQELGGDGIFTTSEMLDFSEAADS